MSQSTVFIVDDNEEFRRSLQGLLKSVNVDAESFGTAVEFLAAYDPDRPGCAIVDVRMPEMTGLELQNRLRERGAFLPLIFLSGHGDIPMAVRAVHAGAVDFLEKPVNDQAIIERVHQALRLDVQRRRIDAGRSEIDRRRAALTPRERQVLEGVVAGQTNKCIASQLGTSVRNVESHRSRVMKKMHVDSLAELVQALAELRPEPAEVDLVH